MDHNPTVFTVSLLNLLSEFDNIEDTLNESFNENKVIKKPLSKEYKEKLEKYVIKKSDIGDLKCAICQDDFQEGETVIKLGCESHYFHMGEDKEKCCGIFPWFDENNTCPICRTEFPYDEEEEEEEVLEEVLEEQEVLEEEVLEEQEVLESPRLIRLNPFFQAIIRNQLEEEQEEHESINHNPESLIDLIQNTLSEVIEERQLEEAIQRSLDER